MIRKLILILVIFTSCEDPVTIIPDVMTYDEVLQHANGKHVVRYEQHADGYLLHLPDGATGIVSRDTARMLCAALGKQYCDYKKL
jgi:hypothetical protein